MNKMVPFRIILHCSATKDSGTVSWGAIRRYHIDELKWTDIGYHFGIENINDHLEILMGRMPDIVGSHVQGYNVGSIGVCVVGNYDTDILTSDHEEVLIKLLHWLMFFFRIPLKEIYGHRDFNNQKSCPGKNLYRFLKSFKGE